VTDPRDPTADLHELELGPIWESLQERYGSQIDPRASLTLDPRELGTEADVVLEADVGLLEPVRLSGESASYTPCGLLGRGGMGEVSLARERVLRREVALKRADASDGAQRALLREALLLGALEHPNIVPVHRLASDEAGRPVLVMKRIAGSSWQDLLEDPNHLTWDALPPDRLAANLQVFTQVCGAVHYAHSRGVLHRDIKPNNVMIGEFGEVYLVDWGLGLRLDERAETPAGVVGTPAYMAPEMLHEPLGLSRQTDVYLLGSTLHQVLTGTPRHSGESPYNVLVRVLRSDPYDYPPEVPRELAALCNAATGRDPARRPESAAELRRAVERFLEHRGSEDLAHRAEEKLTQLEAIYASESGPNTEEAPALFAAARFGFGQALEIWPENPLARSGLQRCLEATIEHELRRGRAVLAKTHLADLPEPRPELAARVAELAREEESTRERLSQLEADLDPTRGARTRAWAAGGLAIPIYGAAALLAGAVITRRLQFTYPVAAAFTALVGSLLAFHLWLGRDWLLKTRPNRLVVGMCASGWGACVLNVALCWAYQIPGWTMILYVGVILTLVAMQLAIAVDRRLWLPAALGAAACLSGLILPGADPILIHVVTGLVVSLYLVAIWRKAGPGEVS